MKTVVVVVVIAAILGAAGYLGFPYLIQKEKRVLEERVTALEQRLGKMETFVKNEEETARAAPLSSAASAQQVTKAVNNLSGRISEVERSLASFSTTFEKRLATETTTLRGGLKAQEDLIAKINKDSEARVRQDLFGADVASIRGSLLKAKLDLSSQNLGSAKGELRAVEEALQAVKAPENDQIRKILEDVRESVKRAIRDLDSDVPGAASRIDLAWRQLGKIMSGR
jgi:Tfp pilus assembly protein PilE